MKAEEFVVISSNDLVRHGISSLLQEIYDHVDITSCNQIHEVMDIIQDKHHAILLLDDDVPKHHQMLSYVKQVRQISTALNILILSEYLSISYIQRLLSAGVDGFIYKQDSLQDILNLAVKTVESGHVFLSPSASILPYESRQHQQLNHTDMQVLQLLACGYNVQEIAVRVNIVDRSVYRIRGKLRNFLGVRTNEQIVDAARKRDLIQSQH